MIGEKSMITNEGAFCHEHSCSHALEFFSKAGSLFKGNTKFYGNSSSALELFKPIWYENELLAMKLLFWLRDCRGGAGNRSGFRECINWLANNDHSGWIKRNIDKIPLYGRYDDFRSLFGTKYENLAAEKWSQEISKNNVLAAKWADRSDKPLRYALNLSIERDFRKLLAEIRKNHIVEHKISCKEYSEIEYHTVPSVAMARYAKLFDKNDSERFAEYKEKVAAGETKINAEVLFPHDCVRTAFHDKEIANLQFDALPNYLEGTNERIIVLSDTSASMCVNVSGSVRAIDISQGLALYCSAKIDKDSPFYKRFIGFASESKFKNWEYLSFSEAIFDENVFDGAIGSTNVHKALELILDTALFFKLSNDKIPTTLLIVSDMQFSCNVSTGDDINNILDKFVQKGYTKPKVVYWNTDGYAGTPDTKFGNNVGLISGFSPAILKAVLTGDGFSPLAVMHRTLEKYEINLPIDKSRRY